MSSFFRRRIAAKLGRVLLRPEDVLLPTVSAVSVSKKQTSADFKVSINTLRQHGFLTANVDIQQQTEELSSQIKCDREVEKVSTDRELILFTVNHHLLVQKMLEPFERHEDVKFGLDSDLLSTLKKGTTLVEYSSPNIAKKFHVGHLRSTIIGNFIANLKQSVGNKVIRMNYLGDWGMQFGLLGAAFDRFGSQEKLKQNPLQHLFEVYVQANKEAEHDEGLMQEAQGFFRQLEQHEQQAVTLWQQFRDVTVKEYQSMYQRLGIHFDLYSGESEHQGQVQEVVQQLQSQGLLKTSGNGTGVVDLSPDGDLSNVCTLLRSDGTSLYLTRDLAAAVSRRRQFDFDEMIYVTDKSQSTHFQHLFQILSSMGHTWSSSCQHVPFGRVRGMKTRTGEVVFLEDVLDEAQARMLDNMSKSKTTKELDDPEDTAERVGISALITQDFKGPLLADYVFDWDRVLQSQGDTGVFLQYTHARLCSLIRRNQQGESSEFNPSLLQEQASVAIVKHLLRYDEVLLQSTQDLQPKHLVNFLLKLCHLIASAHRALPVKGSQQDVAQARLRLFNAARSVLCGGMKILGIVPVDRM